MPRPRTMLAAPSISHGQAAYVIERLVADQRITAAEIQRYVSSMHEEIAALEERLHLLRLVSASTVSFQPPPSAAKRTLPTVLPRRSRRRASPEVRASQQLQGRYVSLIRQIPKYKRGPYQKIAKDHGREAAITAMRKFFGK